MQCPDFTTIIEFAEGGLPPKEQTLVEQHIETGCDACSGALAWYKGFAETAATDRSLEPPPWVTARAVRLFSEAKRTAEERGIRGFIVRLLGSLTFDSLAGDAELAPVRDGGIPSRQLLYKTEPFDVDLLVSSVDPSNGLRVSGQVLATGADSFEGVGGLTVAFEREGEITGTAVTSDFGEFTVENLTPGLYDLRFVGATREIVLERAPMKLE